MISLTELAARLPDRFCKGFRQAKKSTRVVYYTRDTPKRMIDDLQVRGIRLFPIDGTSDSLAKKLGKKYLIHFITF